MKLMYKSTSSILIIGQNPAHRTGNRYTPTISRLNDWMTLLGVRHWSFINSSQAKIARSDNIDWETLELARGYTKVLALGNFASSALAKLSIPHFRLPHPSPLNRKLNDPEYTKNVLRECYNYLHED